MSKNMDKSKRIVYCILAVLISAAIYGWTLWYYGRLCQGGALLSASQVRADTLLPTLTQEFIAALPEILAAVIAWVVLGLEQFPLEIGLKINCRKKELLPLLMERSGAPVWAVWGIPGVLFACMHTLMPMVQNGFTVRNLVFRLLSVLGGYTVGHCGFYALRRWAGTLWLPVLIHGLLDFSSIFIP